MNSSLLQVSIPIESEANCIVILKENHNNFGRNLSQLNNIKILQKNMIFLKFYIPKLI